MKVAGSLMVGMLHEAKERERERRAEKASRPPRKVNHDCRVYKRFFGRPTTPLTRLNFLVATPSYPVLVYRRLASKSFFEN